MANPKHVEILKQGVDVWNKWREENPDVKPDLSYADLLRANLSDADFLGANLSYADFLGANLSYANLIRANLENANFSNANLLYANLAGAKPENANFSDANLSKADLRTTKLTNANITGANLHLTALNNWEIDGIKCDYVYFDMEGKERTPKGRNFRAGEFGELYKQLPTIEYHFEHGFTPIDPIIMNQVVTGINEKHPEFELKIDSFHSRGTPHAKFTVLHKEHVEQALEQITAGYETKIKVLEGKNEQLMQLMSMAVSKPEMVFEKCNIGVIGDNTVIEGNIDQGH